MSRTIFDRSSPSRSSPEVACRIPLEVCDTIIDHLHSLKSVLSSCSTVCTAWLSACRYHLFYDIHLSPELVDFLSSSPHAMETVTPYIRNVALGNALSTAPRDDLNKVISLLLKLDGLHGLSFGTRTWSSLSGTSTRMFLEAEGNLFQNVTTLHLQHLRFASFSLLAAFVGGFSMLHDLSFDNVTWDLADRQLSIRPSRLMKLHIRSSVVPILDWLFTESDCTGRQEHLTSSLRSLSIPEILPNEVHTVGLVLRALGSSLHHLEVGFLTHNHDNADMRNLPNRINLSHNQNLRTIHIHHLTLYQFPHPQRAYPSTGSKDQPKLPDAPFCWLAPFLSNVSSPAIYQLVLYIWLSDEHHLDLVNWPPLTQVLNTPVFAGVRTLQFRVFGLGAGRGDLQRWLLARLGEWRASKNAVQVLFSEG